MNAEVHKEPFHLRGREHAMDPDADSVLVPIFMAPPSGWTLAPGPEDELHYNPQLNIPATDNAQNWELLASPTAFLWGQYLGESEGSIILAPQVFKRRKQSSAIPQSPDGVLFLRSFGKFGEIDYVAEAWRFSERLANQLRAGGSLENRVVSRIGLEYNRMPYTAFQYVPRALLTVDHRAPKPGEEIGLRVVDMVHWLPSPHDTGFHVPSPILVQESIEKLLNAALENRSDSDLQGFGTEYRWAWEITESVHPELLTLLVFQKSLSEGQQKTWRPEDRHFYVKTMPYSFDTVVLEIKKRPEYRDEELENYQATHVYGTDGERLSMEDLSTPRIYDLIKAEGKRFLDTINGHIRNHPDELIKQIWFKYERIPSMPPDGGPYTRGTVIMYSEKRKPEEMGIEQHASTIFAMRNVNDGVDTRYTGHNEIMEAGFADFEKGLREKGQEVQLFDQGLYIPVIQVAGHRYAISMQLVISTSKTEDKLDQMAFPSRFVSRRDSATSSGRGKGSLRRRAQEKGLLP